MRHVREGHASERSSRHRASDVHRDRPYRRANQERPLRHGATKRATSRGRDRSSRDRSAQDLGVHRQDVSFHRVVGRRARGSHLNDAVTGLYGGDPSGLQVSPRKNDAKYKCVFFFFHVHVFFRLCFK